MSHLDLKIIYSMVISSGGCRHRTININPGKIRLPVMWEFMLTLPFIFFYPCLYNFMSDSGSSAEKKRASWWSKIELNLLCFRMNGVV